jgi:hypothetical protein
VTTNETAGNGRGDAMHTAVNTTVNTTASATAQDTVNGTADAAGSEAAAKTAGLRRMVRSLIWDVGLAVAAYYGARALGCSDYVSLLAGTVASAGRITWVALRDRRLDAFAVFLLVLFGVGLGLTFLTGDVRFVLAKDSATTGIAGLIFLGSTAIGRPLSYYAAQRFAGPAGAAQLRAKVAAEPALLRHFTVMSAGWGAGLLAEAVLRIPLVYLLPLDVAVGASNVLMALAYTVLITWTVRATKRIARS